jgi:hypothetical protein
MHVGTFHVPLKKRPVALRGVLRAAGLGPTAWKTLGDRFQIRVNEAGK